MRIHFFFTPVRPWMTKVAILALLVLLAGFGVTSTLGVKQLVQVFATGGDPVFRGPADRPQIGITCNVAWGAEYLPAMLDTLKEKEARATFFMEGRWVEQFPELTRRIFQEYHELGTTATPPLPDQNYPGGAADGNIETEALPKPDGVKPTLLCPYGDWNQEVVKTAAELGYKTIMWSIDTIDWEKPGVEVIVNRVLENHHNGAIVLLHPTEQTVDALPQILQGLKEKGYSLVTVSELLRE